MASASTTGFTRPSNGEGGEQCFVVHPFLRTATYSRDPDARLEEAVGLARAINLDVVHAEVARLSKARPSTLFGKGVVERFRELFNASNPDASCGDDDSHNKHIVVIVDATLTPVQQRNLERAWNSKVIDRNGLILEIFGARARTREGRLQVELASLSYQRSRLVRSWTHLERQRGGAGFMGGPGETQIETDRRQIGQRITRIRRKLKEVKRTRALHRQARRRVPYSVISLVGYTNAGKSTLFNALTDAEVVAKDQLFATLDPTMRGLTLPSGRKVIISDTVGFISDLPHELVNAFHATLEEVLEADLIIHVRDAAHPDSESQKNDVEKVLSELGVKNGTNMVEVLNKIDLLSSDDRQSLINRVKRGEPFQAALSALTGQGIEALVQALDDRLSESFLVMEVILACEDGAALSWLYEHAEVLEREYQEHGVRLNVRIDAKNKARFERLHNKYLFL